MSERRYWDDPNRTMHMHNIEDELQDHGGAKEWEAWLEVHDQIDKLAMQYAAPFVEKGAGYPPDPFVWNSIGVVLRIAVEHYPTWFSDAEEIQCNECSVPWPCLAIETVVEMVLPLTWYGRWEELFPS